MNTVLVTVLGLIVFWAEGVILGLVMKVLLIVGILVAAVITDEVQVKKSYKQMVFL